MLTPNIIQRIETDADWSAVKDHINQHIDSLDSLDGINFANKEEAAIEGLARRLAKDKLLEILEPFYGTDKSTVDSKGHLANKTGVVS